MKITFMPVLFAPLLTLTCDQAWAHDSWGMRAVGLTAQQKIKPGPKPLVVAVIDTGLDISHPALKSALWRNPGETGADSLGRDRGTNGLDDDGNGFIDDVYGWNFARGNANLKDEHGHGTHIAGLIAAQDQHDSRAPGVAPGVQIMVLKYYERDSTGPEQIRALVAALRYATLMHADLINYSGGGTYPNELERQAIAQAGKQGIVLIAAAGNEKSNSDHQPFFPADYDLPNVISVGAHNRAMGKVASSNYGALSVDLFAPGEKIESTLPGDQRGVMTGTSQATAFVTGALALIISQRPDLRDPATLIQHVRRTAQWEAGLAGLSRGQGRLSISRALALQDSGRSFSGYRIERGTLSPTARREISSRDRD